MTDLATIAVRLIVCPRCEARPGARCTTISGRTTQTHSSRTTPVYAAWEVGYAEGLGDALGRVRRRIERGVTDVDAIEAELEQAARPRR